MRSQVRPGIRIFHFCCCKVVLKIYLQTFCTEYDTMDLEMLREVVPMLRQQLEKSMLDRNYVQLERVRLFSPTSTFC